MKLVQLILIVAGLALSAYIFWINNPVTSQLRLQRGRQKMYQQQVLFDIGVQLFIITFILLLVCLVVGIFLFFVIKYYQNINERGSHQYKEFLLLKYELHASAQGHQPNFSGVQRLTYAPNYTQHDTHNPNYTQHHKQQKQLTPRTDKTIDIEPIPQTQRRLPSFLETIERANGDNIILGYGIETRLPEFGTVGGQYCMSVGGGTGSGKTSKAIFLLAQSVANGAKIILVDPHAGSEESLATRLEPLSSAFYCPVAVDEDQILESIRLIEAIFEGRKNGTLPKDETIIFVCDEWLALMYGSLRDQLARIGKILATQARKYNIVGMFMSQEWTADGSGGIRNAMAAHLVCKQRNDEARYQTGRLARQLPNDIPDLKVSQYYLFSSTGEKLKLEAPKVEKEDLEELAVQLGFATVDDTQFPEDFLAVSSSKNPLGFSPGLFSSDSKRETMTETQGNTSQTQFTTEELQIIQLVKQQKSVIEIQKAICEGKKGRAYQEAQERVRAFLEKMTLLAVK